ncbi:MAG: hypothetical protein A2X86_04105 [Bdellovibrionales bacterium GWA2_49_15]|nr:MAG: hypothetical protein A2X86_04105 [Bdellovibrionales bacterium GWA2_49_15]HAZ12810.1 hypothetical protein [Bdellovibrionales bacterium]
MPEVLADQIKKYRKWLIAGLLLVLLLSVAFFFMYRSLPITSGRLKIEGLKNNVTVIRDEFGIPHIKAKLEKDLFFALGFSMASDRLFQMDIMRRIASGRLSEIFGKKTLKIDVLLRNLRIKRAMDDYLKSNLSKIDPVMLENFESYLAGVHHFMKTQPLPPEFLILGYEPGSFTMAESMAVSGYMALSFAEGLVGDILFHELKNKIPAERLAELRLGTRYDATPVEKTPAPDVLRSKTKVTPVEPPKSTSTTYRWVGESVAQLERDFGLFQGSNSWVMSPKRSKSDHALLANDPHIAYMNPSVFYEASLHAPTLELYGHFLPLVPFPVLGHDATKAWAITMSESDDLDIYKEKINPYDENSIWFEQKWTGLGREEEIIKVKGSLDVKIGIKISPHGPMLLPEDQSTKGEAFSNKTAGTDKNYYAVKWSYYHPENHVSLAFYKLMRATSVAEFKDAVGLAASPGLNISWADKDGHIAWWVMGKIPKLPPGVESDAVLEGDSGKHEYLGYLSIDENPHEVDPASGVIVSANYRPQLPAFAFLDGYWQPSDRYERISELLAKKEKWSLEELKLVQTDSQQFQVPKFLPIMLAAVQQGSQKSSPFKGNNYQKLKQQMLVHPRYEIRKKLENKALPFISGWNGHSKIDSVGASIYHSWMKYIGREAIIDELGESDFLRFARLADYRHFYKWLLAAADSSWWDDVRTPEIKETREDIIYRAYSLAIASLDEQFGDQIENWWWGRLHAVEFQHFLGRVKPLNYLFNVGPYMTSGGTHEVNAVAYPRHEDTFAPNVGPATRRLIDLADTGESWGVLPTGESGHLLSPHYRDQALLYTHGEYRKQWFNWEKIEAHEHDRLILVSP